MDESAGRPLRDVYSVSLGVALVLAVEQVVDLERAGVPLRDGALLPFLGFVATAFSLYHWAIRFIDLPYRAGRPRPPSAVITALLVGSTELLLLIGLSTLVSKPVTFLGWLAALLGFEVVAGIVLGATGAYGDAAQFGRRYLLVNALAFAAATAGAIAATAASGTLVAGVLAAGIGWARAVAFYWAGFRLLFGSDE